MPLASDVALALLNGVTWGVAVALVALGLNLIFGLLDIVNVAHGSLYMLGATSAWFVVDATGSFLLALAFAPLAVAGVGALLERGVLRPIEDDPPATAIATFGLVLVFQTLALLAFGRSTRSLATPLPGVVDLGVASSLSYPVYRLVVAGVSLAAMAGLYLFLRRTRHGLWMRGVRQDREIAAAMGVPTSRVYVLTFALGAYFAAFAGVLLAPIVGVHHLMGLDVLAVAFVVVIVGGLGSLRGVLAASLLFAVVENLGIVFVDATPARAAALGLMVVLVLVRPEGLFGGEPSR